MPKPQGVIAQWPTLSGTPAATPPSGQVFVYFKSSDGKLYSKNSAGVESPVESVLDTTLTALAGLTTAANEVPYATGVDTFAMTSLTSYGRSVIGQASASGLRINLGAPKAYSTWFANITAGTWNTVTHNLNTEYLSPQFLVGTPSVPYELEWENLSADSDNTIRFRADLALADVGVLVVGW